MLYGSECWQLGNMSKISVEEMRMLRWITGNVLRDKKLSAFVKS